MAWAFDWYRHRCPWLTLKGVIALILCYFTEFDRSGGRLCLSKIDLYCLQNIVFHFWPKLTHPAARSFCDSWATGHLSLLSTVMSSLFLSTTLFSFACSRGWKRLVGLSIDRVPEGARATRQGYCPARLTNTTDRTGPRLTLHRR